LVLKRPDASSLGKHALKDVVVPEGHKRGDGVAEQRLSRKEIRQPDQFVSLSVQIAAWIKAHTVFLIYGIGVVAVAATLMTGWWAWQKHREQQADIAFYEATKFMRTPSANRLKAVDPLQKLVSDYRGTAATALAYWYLGHLYFEGENYPAALTAYRQAQQRLSKAAQPLMVALATLDVAYAQEASGACDPDAIMGFEAVLQLPAHWLRGEAYLGIGRCHEKTGASRKAVAVYERALSDRAIDEVTRQMISERLALLQPSPKEQG
jgi:predicted negative regulator of RcsB-dependent stress response